MCGRMRSCFCCAATANAGGRSIGWSPNSAPTPPWSMIAWAASSARVWSSARRAASATPPPRRRWARYATVLKPPTVSGRWPWSTPSRGGGPIRSRGSRTRSVLEGGSRDGLGTRGRLRPVPADKRPVRGSARPVVEALRAAAAAVERSLFLAAGGQQPAGGARHGGAGGGGSVAGPSADLAGGGRRADLRLHLGGGPVTFTLVTGGAIIMGYAIAAVFF